LRNYVFVPVPEMSKAAQSEVTEPLGITRRTITLKERTDWYVGLQEKVKVVKPESLIYGEHAEAALEEIKEKFKIA
jgi:hypothetical protein